MCLCQVVWRVDQIACDAIDGLCEYCCRALTIPLGLEACAIDTDLATTILLATKQVVGCSRESCLAEVASMSLAEGEYCALGNLRALIVERNERSICTIAVYEVELLVAIVAIEHSDHLSVEEIQALHIGADRSRCFAVCECSRKIHRAATLGSYAAYEASCHTRCARLE